MGRSIIFAGLVFGMVVGEGSSLRAQQTVTLPATERRLQATFTPAFTIGTDDGEPWEMFSRVVGVVFDAQDNLHVLDQMDPRVLVFDSRGRHLRTIGRRGPGPGEMQGPNAFALLRDGSVVVADLQRRAYSTWDRTGKFQKSTPYRETIVGPTLGGLMGAGTQVLVKPLTNQASGQPDGLFPFYRVDLSTGKGETLLRFDPPVEEQEIRVEATANGATMRQAAKPTFSPTPLMSGFSDGAMAASYSNEYLVRISGGTRDLTIRKAVPARKVSAADRTRFLRERREILERDGQITYSFRNGVSTSSSKPLSAAEIDQRLKAIEFATTMPAISGLVVDGRDLLWIARSPESGISTTPIDLVRADGSYIGTIPEGKLPAAISRTGLAAYIETHPDGYQQIIVKRLVLPAGSM